MELSHRIINLQAASTHSPDIPQVPGSQHAHQGQIGEECKNLAIAYYNLGKIEATQSRFTRAKN